MAYPFVEFYVGAAVHADDLRTTSSSLDVINDQVNIIDEFTTNNCLKLNVSKLEVMRLLSSSNHSHCWKYHNYYTCSKMLGSMVAVESLSITICFQEFQEGTQSVFCSW